MSASSATVMPSNVMSYRPASYLLIASGILAIILPLIAGISIAILLGFALILGGIAYFMAAFATSGFGLAVLRSAVGIIFMIGGVDLILHPGWGLVTLTILLAGALLFEAVAEIIAYFRLHRWATSGWLLANALITLLLALMIWYTWPFSSAWAIGSLVGVNLITSGFAPMRVFAGRTNV